MALNITRRTALGIVVPAILTIGLYIFSVYGFFFPQIESDTIAHKRHMIKELTRTVWELIRDYHQRELSGELTQEEAQHRALARVEKLRYGDAEKDYFWIHNVDLQMLMHPYRTDLIGKDLSGYTDRDGKKLFVEMNEMASRSGGGFVNYIWQLRDNPTQYNRKISYVQLFKPWGWVVGTGVYVDDIEAEVSVMKSHMAKIMFVLMVFISILSFVIIWQGEKSEKLRLEAEKKSYEGAQNLASVFQAMPNGAGLVSERVFVDVNQQMCDMLGYSREAFLGKSTRMIYDSDLEFEKVGLYAYEQIEECGKGVVETKWRKKSGESMDILLSAAPLDHLDLKKGIAFSAMDMTERKEAERALLESEQRLGEIINNSPFVIFIKDNEFRYKLINKQYESVFHLKNEEVEGKTDYDLFPAEICDRLQENDRDVLERRTAIYFDEIVPQDDGEHTYLSVKFPLYNADGEIYAVCGIATDITDRKRMEQRVRDNEENLKITLDSIGDAVIATDMDGFVTRMNPVAEELTCWRFSEALGRPLTDIFYIINEDTKQRLQNPVEKVLESGEIVGLANHTILVARDGTRRHIADSGAPIRDASGDILGVVLVFRDVTDQRRLEDQLRQSQKMDAIGQLAGGVAHDFNNMLGGILGFAEILEMQLSEDNKLKRYAKNIVTAAERASELTGKLLAFSRKGKVLSTPIDIHDAIGDAMALLSRSIDKRVELNSELKARYTSVVGDPSQLQNIFLNLGVNARDAMPNGGTIVFSTTNIELDNSFCESSPFRIEPGRYVRVDVLDGGMGMDRNTMEHIFEPFFTTKGVGKGTGLGLAAVYGTVKDHHGAITVYSELGEGTRFSIYLPVDESVVVSVKEATEDVPRGDGNILLVDDEHIVRVMAQAILEDLGYSITLAGDGREALEIYAENPAGFDAIILDVVMPRMSGRDCFWEFKKINPEAVIIMSSGFSRTERMEELFRAGLFGFVKKPYHRGELAKMLYQAVHKADGHE